MNHSIKENCVLVGFVSIYILMVFLMKVLFASRGILELHFMYEVFFRFSLVVSACFLIIKILKKETFSYFNNRSISGFGVVLLLMPLFKSAFASLKQIIPDIHFFCCDYSLMRCDRLLHFGHLPWKLFKFILDNETIVIIFDRLYMLWFLILSIFCLLMAWSRKRRQRLNFFLLTLVVWAVFGSLLGTTLSSAGPCYYDKVVSKQKNPYQPLMDRIEEINKDTPLWAVHNQQGLWKAYSEKKWLPFGGISAMPSVHVAMAVVFALFAWRVNQFLGGFFWVYLIIIQVSSIILGWHYAVDGYVSICLTMLFDRIIKILPINLSDIEVPVKRDSSEQDDLKRSVSLS